MVAFNTRLVSIKSKEKVINLFVRNRNANGFIDLNQIWCVDLGYPWTVRGVIFQKKKITGSLCKPPGMLERPIKSTITRQTK